MARSTYFETTELSKLVQRGIIDASALVGARTMMSDECRSRVLVVDDERIIADTLTAILNANGFIAERAYCPEEALSHLATRAPDVLITDVIMPGMNGLELASAVRESCPECRIFLLSGNGASLPMVEAARNRGCEFTLLMKPIPPTELMEKISAAPRSRQLSVVSNEERRWKEF